MDFFEKLNRLIGLYVSVIRSVFRLKIWLPFFIYSLGQFVILLICANYIRPTIYPLLSPLVAYLGETRAEAFAHYPGLYLLLPTVFFWAKLLFGIIFEALAAGLTALLFLHAFDRTRESRWKISGAFAKWPQLALAWVVITAVLLSINWFAPRLFSEFVVGSPRRQLALEIGLKFLTLAAYAVFIYAIPAIVVYKQNILRAFKTSIVFFARFPVFSFFLAFIPYLLSVPITYLSDKVDVIVVKFPPELVFYILLAGIIVDMIINYAVTGAVVRFLLEEE